MGEGGGLRILDRGLWIVDWKRKSALLGRCYKWLGGLRGALPPWTARSLLPL
jgi:hypothetical protein